MAFDPHWKVTVLRVPETERPEGIPLHLLIMNSRYPLAGSRHWVGALHRGILYTALDPLAPKAAEQFFINLVEAKASVIEYVSPLGIERWVRDVCANPQAKIHRDRFNSAQWIDLYWRQQRSVTARAIDVWERARRLRVETVLAQSI